MDTDDPMDGPDPIDGGEVPLDEQADAIAESAAVEVLNEAGTKGDWRAIGWHLEWRLPERYGSWHAECMPGFAPLEPTVPESAEARRATEFLAARSPLRCRVCGLAL